MAWYEYPTNYSNGTIADSVAKFFVQYPNQILGDYFGAGVVLMIWLVTFALSMATGTRKALAASSFIAMIFAGYFMIMDAINPVIFFALLGLTIVGLIGGKSEQY